MATDGLKLWPKHVLKTMYINKLNVEESIQCIFHLSLHQNWCCYQNYWGISWLWTPVIKSLTNPIFIHVLFVVWLAYLDHSSDSVDCLKKAFFYIFNSEGIVPFFHKWFQIWPWELNHKFNINGFGVYNVRGKWRFL